MKNSEHFTEVKRDYNHLTMIDKSSRTIIFKAKKHSFKLLKYLYLTLLIITILIGLSASIYQGIKTEKYWYFGLFQDIFNFLLVFAFIHVSLSKKELSLDLLKRRSYLDFNYERHGKLPFGQISLFFVASFFTFIITGLIHYLLAIAISYPYENFIEIYILVSETLYYILATLCFIFYKKYYKCYKYVICKGDELIIWDLENNKLYLKED